MATNSIPAAGLPPAKKARSELFKWTADNRNWVVCLQTILVAKPYLKKTTGGKTKEEKWAEVGFQAALHPMLKAAGAMPDTFGNHSLRDHFEAELKKYQKKTELTSNVSGHVCMDTLTIVYCTVRLYN